MIKQQGLNGEWTICDADHVVQFTGTVPGVIQYDLFRLGLLPDPHYRLNEGLYYDIPEKDWEYTTVFDADSALKDSRQVELVMEGLDTYADVYLNGVHLYRAENMFIPHRVDISRFIRPQDNELRIVFASVLRIPRALSAADPVENHATVDFHRNYIRKAQYSYGWDWGPRLATMGIFRNIYIRYISHAKLQDVYFEALEQHGRDAVVQISGMCIAPDIAQGNYTVVLRLEQNKHIIAERTVTCTSDFCERFLIHDAALWFPVGYGEQPLYDLAVKLYSDGQLADEYEVSCAIRFVRLQREKDARGESFLFLINGIPIFARGANWIPGDNFLPRMDSAHYEKEVGLTRDAGMNMLRVWGGGIYEDDRFYTLCDRFGILVWQDFMFSCAEYPDHMEDFREKCRQEAIISVRRLRNHPCIVLWCGNNENNLGFASWWNRGQSPEFFGNKLYMVDLPRIVFENAPTVPYWASSPYSTQDHPNSPNSGDRHSWEVWSEQKPIAAYLADTGRFISEFGFQAMPCYRTVLEYTAPEDRYIGSNVLMGHNKHNDGMLRLQSYMVTETGLPKDFKSFVYLSQFLQAHAIKTAVEHWRRQKFSTSGALFWQLNDCWPGASWSCVDYAHRKKALFYYAKKFYAACHATIEVENRYVTVTLLNDTLQEQDAVFTVCAYRLNGEKIGWQEYHARVAANSNTCGCRVPVEEFGILPQTELVATDGFCSVFSLQQDVSLDDVIFFCTVHMGGTTFENYVLCPKMRTVNFPQPHIAVQQHGREVTLCSDKPVFSVFAEPENDVNADDNCLFLQPGKECTITFEGDPGQVTVFSFADLRMNS